MKVTKRQLRRIIKEERARLLNEVTPGERDDAKKLDAEWAARVNAEQQSLQSQASLSQLLVDLNEVVDQMMTVLGPEETAQELEGIADEIYRGSR